MKKWILILSALLAPLPGFAQPFSVNWFKVAGGGGTSTNAEFTVSGTFGQHDAGGPMAAGGFSIVGGFWSPLGVAAFNPVGTVPVILAQPQSQIVTNANEVFLSVAVSGTGPFYYQWQKNGINVTDGSGISGATTSNLTVNTTAGGYVGNYSVIVVSAYGTVFGDTAAVTIEQRPVITAQPSALENALEGGSASFTVAVASIEPLSYQWFLNGTNVDLLLTNVFGSTSSNLFIIEIGPYNAGFYSVEVTNLFGSVLSSNGLLNLVYPPSIATQPQPTNQIVVASSNATITVVAAGTEPFSYQWQQSGVILADATNSTLLITNAQREIATNPIVSYNVIVTNLYGSVTSAAAMLNIVLAPDITAQPVGGDFLGGSTNAIFNVTATGTGPLDYQWLFNGTNVSQVFSNVTDTSSYLLLPPLQPVHAGLYSVRVTNLYGSVLSSNAPLTVFPLPPVPVAQSLTNLEDAPLPITLQANDPGGLPVTFAIATSPMFGSLSGSGSNWVYQPDNNSLTGDSFTFTASNYATRSTPATVSISISATNDAPVAYGRYLVTATNTPISFTLEAGDADDFTTNFFFSVLTAPTNGTLSGGAPHLTYTPASNFIGTARVVFKVSDGFKDSAPATIEIAVGRLVRFAVTDMGTINTNALTASAINDSGAATGYAVDDLGRWRPFIHTNGVSTLLTMAGNVTNALGNDINEAGIIAGGVVLADAFTHSNSAQTTLPKLDGIGMSQAFGLNNPGIIVGASSSTVSNGIVPRAVIWSNAVVTPVFSPGIVSEARAINDAGQIAGWFEHNAAPSSRRGFVLTSGNVSRAGALGGANSELLAVNTTGQAAGFADLFGGLRRAVLLTNGILNDLGGLGGDNSCALGIDGSASVVGWSETTVGFTNRSAFLFNDGLIRDLNLLVDPAAGWQLLEARGINSAGQIVGIGTRSNRVSGFILTPIPAVYAPEGDGSWASISVGGAPPDATTPVTITTAARATIQGPTNSTTVGSLTLANSSSNPTNTVTLALRPQTTLTVNNGIYVGSGSTIDGGTNAAPAEIVMLNDKPLVNEGQLTGNLSVSGAMQTKSSSQVSGDIAWLPMGKSPAPDLSGTIQIGPISGQVGSTNKTITTNGPVPVTNSPPKTTVTIAIPTGLSSSLPAPFYQMLLVGTKLAGQLVLKAKQQQCLACATLGGASLALKATSGTKFKPGNSPGTIEIDASLELDPDTRLEFEFGPPGIIGQDTNDLMIVGSPSNSVTVALAGFLDVTALPGFGPGTYTALKYYGTLTTSNFAIGNVPAGYTYQINTTTPGQVNLIVTGNPPVVSSQPTNLVVLAGSNASFSVQVTGNEPLTYRWRKEGTGLTNGGNISGAFTNTLTLTVVTPVDEANYSVIITNSFGSTTSSIASLTVSLPVGYNQISGQIIGGGGLALSYIGLPGTSYALERTFNLNPPNWIPQITNPAGVNGVLVFTNTPNPTTNNFWRVRLVP